MQAANRVLKEAPSPFSCNFLAKLFGSYIFLLARTSSILSALGAHHPLIALEKSLDKDMYKLVHVTRKT
jgi:hypothetical protein